MGVASGTSSRCGHAVFTWELTGEAACTAGVGSVWAYTFSTYKIEVWVALRTCARGGFTIFAVVGTLATFVEGV